MRDPFVIEGPTCISFSGGRTSAYMLWRALQAHGGKLPDDARVVFANTGKEDEATLRFVRDCGQRWGVPIVWVQYRDADAVADRWEVVTFETAAREGEPFSALNRRRNMLPAPMARFCTGDLKIKPSNAYCRSQGWAGGWDAWMGIRADEQRRVAKMRGRPADGSGIETHLPLAVAGVTRDEVGVFWRAQAFDLGLPNMNGVTMHGNCDLCYLKPTGQLVALIAEKPSRATWWIAEEAWAKSITRNANCQGIRFRPRDPTYTEMARFAAEQRDMFDPAEEAIPCFCGD